MHKITWENKGQPQGEEVWGLPLKTFQRYQHLNLCLQIFPLTSSFPQSRGCTMRLFPISCQSRRSFWLSKEKKIHLTLSFLDIKKKYLLKYLES